MIWRITFRRRRHAVPDTAPASAVGPPFLKYYLTTIFLTPIFFNNIIF